MEKLVGREREIHELELSYNSNRSEMVVLYGRRRVGKTFLVRNYFQDKYTFHFVGAHKKTKSEQLENFGKALARYGLNDIPSFENWSQAFDCLITLLENSADERKVVFLDEMPWADTKGSEFLTSFEYFWNNWVSGRDDIMLVACGSATSWMKEKLEDNQGGLHNRKTRVIYLRPFNLHECKQYLDNHGIDWDEYQTIQCYMVMGGIPYYMSLLEPELSLQENIDNLYFRRNGALREEFHDLYSALFRKSDSYISVVKFLSEKREGFLRDEIEAKTGLSGGTLSKILKNLERCDFISAYSQFGNKTKLTLYRLCDFYTLFYFRFIMNDNSKDEHYWSHHFTDRSVESWQGFTFEQVCLQHLEQIKKALGINGMATEASAWRYVAPKSVSAEDEETEKRNRGAQIDLVIKRADRITHLCEMKFSQIPYSIAASYTDKLLERKSLFMTQTGTQHGVVMTFVTPYGLANSKNSSLIHSVITAKDLMKE